MSRFSDCIALTKPRVTWMVVATGAVGMYLAKGPADWRLRMVFLLGTVMLVSGANAMNMYLERDIDGRAERTRNRPLPAGRLPPWTALVLGLGLGTSSVVWLALCVNLLTAVLGLLAFLSYTALYTPLKQRSAGALVIGAIPGAMPPLMGWTAITNRLDLIGLTLFAIMFLWQLPHFIAIALFRYDDYRKAGFKTLVSEMGVATAKFQVVLYLLLLCPVALVLVPLGVGGKLYLWIAFVSGIGFLVVGVQGLRTSEDGRWAKRLFKVSLLYLTVVFGAMLAGQAVQGDDAVPMFVARHNPG
ncbi:MAG TPA: heme o synthase [Pseudomonadota bacterium]|nr:heme o synthase [Pseudomonadota bacterium]